jgi:homoserine O-acetyltransferase
MGGMQALEWPLCSPEGYVKAVIPISTSVDHDAWGISWAEAQRQCIFADPVFEDGYYLPTPKTQPASGLAAARMVAMLTYRSSPSFSTRFGRAAVAKKESRKPKLLNGDVADKPILNSRDIKMNGCLSPTRRTPDDPIFTAQSYLQYQGQKFVNRFDANCFIHLTRKMDHHDVTRGRIRKDRSCDGPSREQIISDVFSRMPPKALVVGIESDVLFRPEQQETLANALPDASLVMIPSPEGHDGFLLEFEILGPLIEEHLRERCPWIYDGPPLIAEEPSFMKVVKDSVFGEVESG